MADKPEQEKQPPAPDPVPDASLAYGPNPALSAQGGVDAPDGGYQQHDYPDATPALAVPPSDHGTGAAASAQMAKARVQAAKVAAKDDDAGLHPGKTGATPEEQVLATPSPALDAAEGAEQAAKTAEHGPAKAAEHPRSSGHRGSGRRA